MSTTSVVKYSSTPPFFNPLTIPGCTFWLDAADRSTMTFNGTKVSQVLDKSGTGNTISQATAGFQPTLSLDPVYNKTGLYFVRNNGTCLTVADSAVYMVNGINWNAFMVYRMDGTSASVQTVTRSPVSGRWVRFQSNFFSFYVLNSDIQFSAILPDGGVFSQIVATANQTIYKNGTSVGSGGRSGSSLVQESYNFGGTAANTECMGGYIFEYIIFSGVTLTTFQQQQMEGYLAWKWGLQGNLPSNHAFKNNAPFTIVNPAPALPPFSGRQAPLYFDPRSISGCQLWLDAADSSTVTVSAGSVTQVNDKSGNGYTLTGGTGFTYPNNIFNGRYPSFYNAASTNGYIGSNISFSLSQPLTAFAVGQSLAGSGTFPYIMDSAPGGSSRIAFYYWNSGGLRVRLFAGGEIEYIGAASTFFNSYYANTTASEIFVNGTSVVSGSIGSGSLSRLIVGNAQYITGSGFIGHLCEVLFFRSVLPTTQRQQIEGYLAWKWGLQANLPSNHPYRNSLPTPYPLLTLPKPIVRGRFQPKQLTGLQLWLDAADASTLFTDTGATTLATLGQTIARWNDKSGNGNYAYQNTAGNRPTYTKSAVNALSLYFSTNSIQLVSISNNTTTGNSSRTVFAVSYSPGTTSRSLTGTGTHAGNTPPSAFGLDNSPATAITIIWYPYVYTAADNTQSVSVKNLFVHHAYYDASVSRIGGKYSFGNDQSKSTTLNTTASPWYFGNRPDGGGSVDSYFSEFLHYNRVLSPSEVSQIEGYLAWKWGLVSNLPSTHPFKLFPPPP